MFRRICKITFISHGATVHSLDGIINDTLKYPKLNEFGEEEIQKVCEYLEKRGVPYDKIYTSPNACCSQSAQIIAKLFKQKAIQLGLNPRNHGVWHGTSIMDLYKEIVDQIDGSKYESIIPKIVSANELQYEDAEKAIEENNDVLFEGSKPIKYKLVEVKPKVDRVTRFKRISTPSNKKIDYVKRAKENAKTGLLGENLILAFEIDRLNKLGLEEYASKVKQVSLINDVLGYDIRSFDLDVNGNVHEIYIEVKTSNTPKDVDFYVSRNEVEQSKVLGNNYWLYRVYNCNLVEKEPKFYRVNGPIDSNFDLTPDTYKASIKKDANIVSSIVQINEKMIEDIQSKDN